MGKTKSAPTTYAVPDGVAKLLDQYGCGPVRFTGTDDALYERRLAFDHVIDPKAAGPRQQFEALSWALRDVLAQRWVKTDQHHDRANPKQVYYLSMEFLIGRSLANNIANALFGPAAEAVEKTRGLRLSEVLEQEPDAGLPTDPGHRVRPAVRLRHLPPGTPERVPGRAAGQLAEPPRPVGGGSADGSGVGPTRVLVRGQAWTDRGETRSSDGPRRGAV